MNEENFWENGFFIGDINHLNSLSHVANSDKGKVKFENSNFALIYLERQEQTVSCTLRVLFGLIRIIILIFSQ